MAMRRMFALFACISIIVIFTVLPAFAQQTAVPTQDTVKLEYKFVPGDLSRYKMVFDMNAQMMSDNQSGMAIPPMNIKLVGFVEQEVKRVLENGDAEITVKIPSLKMTMMDSTTDIPVDKIPVITLIMSKQGIVKSISGLENINAITGGIPLLGNNGTGYQYSAFPDKPLSVGDTWSLDLPIPGGTPIHYEAKMLEIGSKVGNYTVAVYSENVNGDMSFTIDPSKAAVSQTAGVPPVPIAVKMLMKGTSKFSPDLGKVINSTGSIDISMDVTVNDSSVASSGMTMPLKMSMQGTYTVFIMPSEEPK